MTDNKVYSVNTKEAVVSVVSWGAYVGTLLMTKDLDKAGTAKDAIDTLGGIVSVDQKNSISGRVSELCKKAWDIVLKKYKVWNLRSELRDYNFAADPFHWDSYKTVCERVNSACKEIKQSEYYTETLFKMISSDVMELLGQMMDNDLDLKEIIQLSEIRQILETLLIKQALPLKESIKTAITTIPAQNQGDFVGREKEISHIKTLLKQQPIVSINAYGGVGKTAVATRIINDIKDAISRNESKFKHIAWIRSTGDLKSDLSLLDLPSVESATSIEDKFKAACAFLDMNPTFLVIDNIERLPSTDDVNILNTVSRRTKILITSRLKIKKTTQYHLDMLNKEDAISLFYKHYIIEETVIDSDSNGEKEYVEKIVAAASYNALLIELISKMACWEYTSRLEELWSKLEKNVFGTDSEIDIDTDHAASHNVDELSEVDLKLKGQIRSLYQISSLDDTKQEFMRFFAAFPPETMIFANVFKWAGFKVTDIKFLSDRGWIVKIGEGFLIHTMVKGSVELQNRDFDIEKYENLINKLNETEEYLSTASNYKNIAERLIVLETVCELLLDKESKIKGIVGLLNSIIVLYFFKGDYTKAFEYGETVLDIGEKVLELEHPFKATSYNNIALVYRAQGDYAKALEYCKKALEIWEKALGLEHPHKALLYNNIALVYQAQADYAKALEYCKKALEIRNKVLGIEHPLTARTYDSIALVYQNQGDYAKALEYCKKALEINEKVLGIDHSFTAITYNNIAEVYRAKGDYAKALEYNKKALEIWKNLFGEEHPDTAGAYNNIATVYHAQGDYTKALEYYKKALTISEKVLGLWHQYTETMYNNIAGVYHAQGDYTKALEYYKKALTISEKVLGLEHPNTATTYYSIAGVYEAQGDYTKALDYSKKALKINEKVIGVNHPDTAIAYNNIAGVYQAQGDYAKALKYIKRTLEIWEKVHGMDHPDTAIAYNNIAGVYQAQGDYTRALEHYKKALEIWEKVFEVDHPNTATIYNNIAGVYHKQGNYEMALEYYKKALEISKKVLGLEHTTTATIYNNIAGVYRDQNIYVKALEYYKKALGIREKVLGVDHPSIAKTYNHIAEVYGAQGIYVKELKYSMKALTILEKVYGVDHQDTAMMYNNIGCLYCDLNNYEAAKKYLQKAYEIRKKLLGKGHPHTKGTKESLEVVIKKIESK